MNKNQKKSIFTIVGMLILAGAMFAYQNFFMPAQQQARRAVVYIANRDISDDTIINIEGKQFDEIQISDDSVLEGSVTNLSKFDGKVIEGGLLKGELLTEFRIVDQQDEKGTLFVKVEPDFPVDIRDGENVRVFVQGKDEFDKSAVAELFTQKQVYSSSKVTNLLEGDSTQGYYLRVDDEELIQYYEAKTKGSIIMAKISATSGDVTETIEGKRVKLEELAEKAGVMRYVVEEGDTYESIANDLSVRPEMLKIMNPNVKTLEVGDKIIVPET